MILLMKVSVMTVGVLALQMGACDTLADVNAVVRLSSLLRALLKDCR